MKTLYLNKENFVNLKKRGKLCRLANICGSIESVFSNSATEYAGFHANAMDRLGVPCRFVNIS